MMVGIYRGEFVKLIERAAINRAVLKFYVNRFGRQDTMSIVDFDLPRREGMTSPMQTANDWFQEAFLCNIGVLEHSWIPFLGIDDDKILARGAKTAIEILLLKHSITRTPEIAQFLRNPDLKLMEA